MARAFAAALLFMTFAVTFVWVAESDFTNQQVANEIQQHTFIYTRIKSIYKINLFANTIAIGNWASVGRTASCLARTFRASGISPVATDYKKCCNQCKKCFHISSILLDLSSITRSQAGLIYLPLEPVERSWNLHPQDSSCFQVKS